MALGLQASSPMSASLAPKSVARDCRLPDCRVGECMSRFLLLATRWCGHATSSMGYSGGLGISHIEDGVKKWPSHFSQHDVKGNKLADEFADIAAGQVSVPLHVSIEVKYCCNLVEAQNHSYHSRPSYYAEETNYLSTKGIETQTG